MIFARMPCNFAISVQYSIWLKVYFSR